MIKLKAFFAGFTDWFKFIVFGADEAIDKYLAGDYREDVASVGVTIEPVAKHWGIFVDGELTTEYSRKADALRGAERKGYKDVRVVVG